MGPWLEPLCDRLKVNPRDPTKRFTSWPTLIYALIIFLAKLCLTKLGWPRNELKTMSWIFHDLAVNDPSHVQSIHAIHFKSVASSDGLGSIEDNSLGSCPIPWIWQSKHNGYLMKIWTDDQFPNKSKFWPWHLLVPEINRSKCSGWCILYYRDGIIEASCCLWDPLAKGLMKTTKSFQLCSSGKGLLGLCGTLHHRSQGEKKKEEINRTTNWELLTTELSV